MTYSVELRLGGRRIELWRQLPASFTSVAEAEAAIERFPLDTARIVTPNGVEIYRQPFNPKRVGGVK